MPPKSTGFLQCLPQINSKQYLAVPTPADSKTNTRWTFKEQKYSETWVNYHLTIVARPCIVTTVGSPNRSSNVKTKLPCLFPMLYIPYYDQVFIPTYSVKPCLMWQLWPLDCSYSLWLWHMYKPEWNSWAFLYITLPLLQTTPPIIYY